MRIEASRSTRGRARKDFLFGFYTCFGVYGKDDGLFFGETRDVPTGREGGDGEGEAARLRAARLTQEYPRELLRDVGGVGAQETHAATPVVAALLPGLLLRLSFELGLQLEEERLERIEHGEVVLDAPRRRGRPGRERGDRRAARGRAVVGRHRAVRDVRRGAAARKRFGNPRARRPEVFFSSFEKHESSPGRERRVTDPASGRERRVATARRTTASTPPARGSLGARRAEARAGRASGT
jgi:hypothetical protein